VESFNVGEKSIEERGRLVVFAINRRQVIRQIGETRIITANRREPGRAALVTAQLEFQLQITAARPLEQQLPCALAEL
jgi:hypothetical protein